MKKVFNKLLVLTVVLTAVLSCEEYLEVNPNFGIESDDVFKDYFATKSVVDRAYRLINNPVYNNNDWNAEFGVKSDELQVAKLNGPIATVFNSGNWFNQNWRDLGGMSFLSQNQEFGDARDRFGNAADKGMWGIRAVNQVLENIESIEEYPEELGFTAQQLKDQLIGQCYYLRAFHYFQIIRRYGGITIMDRVFDSATNFDEPRPSYLECSDFILEDLDRAIALLPVRWTGPDFGRGSKSSARALKAMVALYAASPLMNPQLNPYGSNGKQYNQEYARVAVDAAVEAINGFAAGGYEMHTFDEYGENWYSRTNPFSKETLIVAPHSPYTDPVTSRFGRGWFLPQFMGGWGAACYPTQNAVDWFETASGYDINDPEAETLGGFDPSNPYDNRDPRLSFNIFTNGDDLWEGLTQAPNATQRIFDASVGGFHYNWDTNRNTVFTGYYAARKHNWPGNDRLNNSTGWFTTFPYIRVPQTYLDLAEAANEIYGPNGAIPGTSLTAVSAINVVRNRANMPNVLSKYTTDKETFKARIYNERAVELYFEEHRWYDLKRWHLAKEVLGDGDIYLADIQEVNGELVYDKKVDPSVFRVFEDKHYWYPFPTSVMNNFSVFEQNPGW
ncbi:MAG: RagB/SusD family nutrient uptake outer membrane protein [Jejuia sp.]